MNEKLTNNNIPSQHITISAQDYHNKVVNEHEIEINGKLYDIRSVVFTENTAKLSVIADQKEFHILSILKKIGGGKSDDHSPFPQKLLSFMSMLFIQSNLTYAYHFPNTSVAQYPDLVQLLSLGNIENPFSPPDCI